MLKSLALGMQVSETRQTFNWANMGSWFEAFFMAVHYSRMDVDLRTGEFHVDFGESNISCSG